MQHALLARGVIAQHFHGTLRDQQAVAGGIAFVEQRFPIGVRAREGMLGQILQCRRRQALQQCVRAQQAARLSEAALLRVRRAARGRVDKSHFIFRLCGGML